MKYLTLVYEEVIKTINNYYDINNNKNYNNNNNVNDKIVNNDNNTNNNNNKNVDRNNNKNRQGMLLLLPLIRIMSISLVNFFIVNTRREN